MFASSTEKSHPVQQSHFKSKDVVVIPKRAISSTAFGGPFGIMIGFALGDREFQNINRQALPSEIAKARRPVRAGVFCGAGLSFGLGNKDVVRAVDEVKIGNASNEAIPISTLPDELLLNIFSFLGLKSLARSCEVNRHWNRLSYDKSLWSGIFKISHFDRIKTNCGNDHKYSDLTKIFDRTQRFSIVIAGCQKAVKLKDACSGFGLMDICKAACDLKDYDMGLLCQQLAKQYHSEAGNEAMSYFIRSRVADSNFIKIYKKLIKSSLDLVMKDREFGLEALITITKKLADLELFEESMKYTQLAEELQNTRKCDRPRILSDDIHPCYDMAKHLLRLKQYKLAEECAKKMRRCNCHENYFIYSKIVIAQFKEENIINEKLLSELRSHPSYWTSTSTTLAIALIDYRRYKEAKKFAKSVFAIDKSYVGSRPDDQFNCMDLVRDLRDKLIKEGLNIKDWLTPNRISFYDV